MRKRGDQRRKVRVARKPMLLRGVSLRSRDVEGDRHVEEYEVGAIAVVGSALVK